MPGLDAKPIIDIQISVAAFEPLDAYRLPLESLGYTEAKLPFIWQTMRKAGFWSQGLGREPGVERHLMYLRVARVAGQCASRRAPLALSGEVLG